MSNMRKLSAFRQLSLNCGSPTPEQRRKNFKKQFSEDRPDSWLDRDGTLKISLTNKSNRFDRPPPIKIAWEDDSEFKAQEAVIIKKCKEVRRASTGKLSRQTSLDKDSILHSKQEIADRLRQHAKEKEQEKNNIKEIEHEKTNLKIFLSLEQKERFVNNPPLENDELYRETPRLIQALVTHTNGKNLFQIHRNKQKIDLHETAYSPTRSKDIERTRPNTVVVIPIVEKNTTAAAALDGNAAKRELKPIDVTIRPMTAAAKREKFQRRSNSAFTVAVTENLTRPTLIRSSSAQARPEKIKSKFLATRRKVRSAKRSQGKNSISGKDLESSISNEETSTTITTSDIVTMVSLVSPAGSEGEEEALIEEKEKFKRRNNVQGNGKKEENEMPKNMSSRKTAKTVSFQQSSIHAIRSFSASFPARRGSMATAIMSGNNANTPSSSVQEKRATNATTPDDDERVAKRRLLRSNTAERKGNSCDHWEEPTSSQTHYTDEEGSSADVNFSVDINSKDPIKTIKPQNADNAKLTEKDEDTHKPTDKTSHKEESTNERQCRELHRKMTEKGINVSLDTILRGMLTPTEYRMSRQNSLAKLAAAAEETGDNESEPR